jgi:hypothetical protein
VTVELVGAGEFTSNPGGNVHCASDNPHTPAPGGGALLTVRLAEANFPVSSVLTKRWSDTLLYVPVVGAVTFTLIVQLPLAGTAAFDTEMEAAPAVIVGEPHPEEEAFAGLATTIALGVVGRVSEKFKPLITTGAELVSVKISVDTPPALDEEGLKVFEMFTAAAGSRI